MKDIEIIQVKTEEDCDICDNFLSNLIEFESRLDSTILPTAKVSGLCKKNKQHDGVYIAYAKEDKPIGYIFGYFQTPKGQIRTTNVLILEALYIDEQFRHKGVGEKLLKSFESWADKKFNGDYKIEITCIASNEVAKKFYEKMGYLPVKTILRK